MIIADNISKKYKKEFVLENVNVEIQEGKITGIAGHNGAGKTTLMRIFAGLISPTAGQVKTNVGSHANKMDGGINQMGVLFGGDIALYPFLTARENIEFYAHLRGMDEKSIKNRLNELDHYLHFSSFLGKRAYGLSRGMRQKIAIARAIIHDPEILILDEPTMGLDIKTTLDIHYLLKKLKNEKKTIIVSTHDIYEIEQMLDCIIVLRRGKVAFKESLELIENKAFFVKKVSEILSGEE